MNQGGNPLPEGAKEYTRPFFIMIAMGVERFIKLVAGFVESDVRFQGTCAVHNEGRTRGLHQNLHS